MVALGATPFTYRLIQLASGWWVRRLADLRVEGLENVPRTGPCILLPNHQSVIDPIVVQSVCRRTVHTMTKSTQFSSAFFRALLGPTRAFPVRRYRVDPQAVRILLRLLQRGEGVCLYPEGERSWEGTLQPLRRGAVRVVLRAGVPVIPVGLDGTYDVWPRWAARPRGGQTVHLRFGSPLHFRAHRTRADREAALPEAERVLRDALLELSGEAARSRAWEDTQGSRLSGVTRPSPDALQ